MIKSIKINNSEMQYATFWTWEKNFVIIPWISMQSVLTSEDALIQVFEKFKEEYTIYIFDRLKEVPKNYSIENMAEDTKNAINKIWLSSINLYWASQWWMIAQYMAIKYPNLINKLILWSTTSKTNGNTFKIFSKRIELAKQGDKKQLAEIFAKNIYSETTIKNFWEIIKQPILNASEEELKKFTILASSMLYFDLKDKIKAITSKTFVIWSIKDWVFWENATKELAEEINCKYYLYDWFWHAVYDEAPDFYNEKIRNFLNEE